MVLPAGSQVSIIPSVQCIRLGAGQAGLRARIRVDENTVHVLVNGKVVKPVPSTLDAEHLHQFKLRGARPAGPPPALPAVDRVGDLPSHHALEVVFCDADLPRRWNVDPNADDPDGP